MRGKDCFFCSRSHRPCGPRSTVIQKRPGPSVNDYRKKHKSSLQELSKVKHLLRPEVSPCFSAFFVSGRSKGWWSLAVCTEAGCLVGQRRGNKLRWVCEVDFDATSTPSLFQALRAGLDWHPRTPSWTHFRNLALDPQSQALDISFFNLYTPWKWNMTP